MPSPREVAQKQNQLGGEPSGYCGVCGVPNEHCDCGKYKEHGANATNAGSEHTDDPFAGKNMSGGEKKAEGGEKKAEGGEKKADNNGGGKPPFGGAKPFGKKE